MPEIPWFRLARLAVVATLLMTFGVLVDVRDKGHSVGIVQPGLQGPSADVFAEDFPDLGIPDSIGHDGQQFYAVARAPMHLDEVSEHLDRPRYRLQRPLFPIAAWALSPTGGGQGLVNAFVVVGMASLVLAGLMAGALSVQLGGGIWPAFLIPLLPGSYSALRLTLADTLALGLLLAALFAAERDRRVGAALAAALSVLAKESGLVVLVGHALVRRTRAAIIAAVAATVVVGGWWLALHALVEADNQQVLEFTWPFGGIVRSLDDWSTGKDVVAAVTVVGTFVLAGIALWRRGRDHRLFGALAALTTFSAFLGPDVLGLDFNGPRTIGPVLVLAIVMLGTPTTAVVPLAGEDVTHG